MKTQAGLQEKLLQNKDILYFKELFKEITYSPPSLVGGAIVDILNDKVPKDFDFINSSSTAINKLLDAGFEFQYESIYSTTFKKDKLIVQFLKTQPSSFDFTISKASLNFSEKNAFSIDLISFNSKRLIPNNFDNTDMILSSLARIPHWVKKGYFLPNQTYISLLGKLASNINAQKICTKS